MSTVFEPAIGGGLAPKTGNSNGTAVGREREINPLGINAQKVVAKRYSLKDENGEPIETWGDIVRRVVGHVSRAETDQEKQRAFYAR
jgi:Ribonucleotide reductase, all-alpha domain.